MDCVRKMEVVEDSTSDSGESVVFLSRLEERKICDRNKEEQSVKVEKDSEPICKAPKPETYLLKSLVSAKSKKYPCGDSVKKSNTRKS